jgi:cell shape-determining protein MreD
MSSFQSAKILLAEVTSLGKDALHVYVGLGVMLAVAIAFRRPLSDWRPLLAVALASIAGELWDVIDTFSHGGRPRWSGNTKDIWNTLFWPTVFFLLARFTRVLKR